MNNKVLLENPLRKRLARASAILLLYFLLMMVLLWVFASLNNKNFNGQTDHISGVVEAVYNLDNDDPVYIKLQDGEAQYNANVIYEQIDFDNLAGKNVVLVTPQKQFGQGAKILLGITVEGTVVVDYEVTVVEQYAANRKAVVAFAVIGAVVGAATCAIFIWRVYTSPTKEFDLAPKYVEFYANRQPLAPQRSYVNLVAIIWSLSVITLFGVMAIINAITAQDDWSNTIFLIVLVSLGLAGLIAIVIVAIWAGKKEIDFYAQNYPFDFNDISHLRGFRRGERERLQQELQEEHKLHPNDFGDGGNGYLVTFTESGVELREPDFELLDTTPPEAENVFDMENTQPQGQQPVLTLSYEQLNLEALPFFFRKRPLFVVVKSRLVATSDFPEEFVNDLHFLLDTNLLETLNRFSVKVENLDDILQNKKELMLKNCGKRKKHNKK